MDDSNSNDGHRKRVRIPPSLPRADPSKALPPETLSYILSFLPPPSLLQSAQVSRSWSKLCMDEALWRDLAIHLGYCQLERAAEERRNGIRVIGSVLQLFKRDEQDSDLLQTTIQRYRSRNTTSFFDTCNSWRSLCCHLWHLNRNWSPSKPAGLPEPEPEATTNAAFSGTSEADSSTTDLRRPGTSTSQSVKASAASTYLFPNRRQLHVNADGSGVWRCKIDPEERTFIVTGQNGGIQVFDHSSKTLLWHIPRTATRPFPHLEFSQGWLIFDRPGIGHFEVWRSERLVPDLGRAPDRGHYQRFTILSTSRPTRAYRFQFPYLCAASQDGFITIWHVPHQQVVETIDMRDSPHRDGNITYIDFDDEFVFLNGVGAKSVSVFSRLTQRLVWNLGQHFASGAPPPTTWRLEDNQSDPRPGFYNPAFSQRRLIRASPNLWQAGPNTMNLAQLTMTPYQIWSAVHPDLKTNTLLVLGQGTVLLLKDYKKVFDDPSQAPDLFIEIEFQNLQEYYDSVVLNGQDDWSGLGWNSRRLWEHRSDAQLTVHEGKAVIINGHPLILDLDVESDRLGVWQTDSTSTHAAHAAEQQQRSQLVESTSSSSSHAAEEPSEYAQNDRHSGQPDASSEQHSPPVLVYTEVNRPAHESYRRCSSVQMDEVGIYITADKLTDDTPFEFQFFNGDDLTGADRVLLHFDFSQRHKLVPRAREESSPVEFV